MSAPRPTVIYDGDCGFCQASVERWSRRTGEAVEYLSSLELGERHPEVPRGALRDYVFLVEPDGTLRRGADAVLRVRELGGRALLRRCYERLPGFRPLAEWGYRRVARNRHRLPGSSCRLPERS